MISPGFPARSTHVRVLPGDDCHAIRRELEEMLEQRFKIACRSPCPIVGYLLGR
jgi:hypothetical protein